MSVFKADEAKTKPSQVNYLSVPYLGPVKFLNFERKKVGSTENCFVAETELLGEDIKGNDVSGTIQEYVEWNPAGKDEKQIENAVNRLNYFAQHLVPKEEALGVEAQSWEEYVDKIIQLLKRHNAVGKTAKMKFAGSVWQGKPKISTPGYHNFIATEDSESELEWSNSEKEGNRQYLEAKNSTPTSPEDADAVEDLGEQQF